MSEQELYMMSEEKGKDEISAQNLMKKHASFENEIDNFYGTVMQLGDIAKQLIAAKHPRRYLYLFTYLCTCKSILI